LYRGRIAVFYGWGSLIILGLYSKQIYDFRMVGLDLFLKYMMTHARVPTALSKAIICKTVMGPFTVYELICCFDFLDML